MKQALVLPTICNINPRSIYNKLQEFITFVEEEKVDCAFLSESWERENLSLNEVIKIENYKVVANVSQRKGLGGRPAIIVNERKYDIIEATNSIVQIPWGVEAVWAILIPKSVNHNSKIQAIACCAFYLQPGLKNRTLLLDHFSDAYNVLGAKYPNGLEFIIAGDANRLKLDAILNLNPKFSQIVRDPTRLNPPAILDPVITTLPNCYQVPECLSPLDPDENSHGKRSDHRIVLVKPISEFENVSARVYRQVKVRPITETGIKKMKSFMIDQTWSEVYAVESAHQKAENFHLILEKSLESCFPMKMRKFSNNDQPWMNCKLKDLDRKRRRVYRKERRSESWKSLNKEFKKQIKAAKANFYSETVKDLKMKKPGQWYSCLKRIASKDQGRFQTNIEEINHLSDQDQADEIANKFASIPNSYDALEDGDINVPEFTEKDIPQIRPAKVWKMLSRIKTNKAVIEGDFPPKLVKMFAPYLAEPLADIINAGIQRGEYPNIYKCEISTPVPKKFPPKSLSDVRNISGLMTFDKIFENILSEMMIKDMEPHMDNSQYGNKKGASIQNYLINMLHKILTELDDKGEPTAIIASFIDWNNAFPRQCPKLGIKSFLRNGVRASLIPILINFFQNRQMSVKWHGCRSRAHHLKGGGPQGGTMGILEYISQSSGCADCVDENGRFRFLDDLSTLEKIYLLTVGLASVNVKQQVPNDINESNQFIPSDYLNTQNWLQDINEWTKNQKMLINAQKTDFMIFNFTDKYQFTARLELDGQVLQEVQEKKLLGTYITNDLKWDKNTNFIVKKANAAMELLRRLSAFNIGTEDMKTIYILFVRSQLEQSAVVWHSLLTEENRADLERVQKSALRIILGSQYKGYRNALEKLDLPTLEERRKSLCLKFALNCINNEKSMTRFELNEKTHEMKTRNSEVIKVQFAKTERLKNSPIIYMQKLVNEYMNTKH